MFMYPSFSHNPARNAPEIDSTCLFFFGCELFQFGTHMMYPPAAIKSQLVTHFSDSDVSTLKCKPDTHVCGKKKLHFEEEGTPFTDATRLTPLELDKIIIVESFKANTCFMRNQKLPSDTPVGGHNSLLNYASSYTKSIVAQYAHMSVIYAICIKKK